MFLGSGWVVLLGEPVSLFGLLKRLRMALAGAATIDDFTMVVVTTPKTMAPITRIDIILRVAISRLEGPQLLVCFFCSANLRFIVRLMGPSCFAAKCFMTGCSDIVRVL